MNVTCKGCGFKLQGEFVLTEGDIIICSQCSVIHFATKDLDIRIATNSELFIIKRDYKDLYIALTATVNNILKRNMLNNFCKS